MSGSKILSLDVSMVRSLWRDHSLYNDFPMLSTYAREYDKITTTQTGCKCRTKPSSEALTIVNKALDYLAALPQDKKQKLKQYYHTDYIRFRKIENGKTRIVTF